MLVVIGTDCIGRKDKHPNSNPYFFIGKVPGFLFGFFLAKHIMLYYAVYISYQN
jgi:hypothetical protein